MKKLVVVVDKLRPKQISKLVEDLEDQGYDCYMEDDDGYTYPAMQKDWKKIFK